MSKSTKEETRLNDQIQNFALKANLELSDPNTSNEELLVTLNSIIKVTNSLITITKIDTMNFHFNFRRHTEATGSYIIDRNKFNIEESIEKILTEFISFKDMYKEYLDLNVLTPDNIRFSIQEVLSGKENHMILSVDKLDAYLEFSLIDLTSKEFQDIRLESMKDFM